MDTNRLRVLREFADRGNVADTAKALHCSPSSVSQQIKTLEREAGLPLTVKRGRRILLTEAGEALAEAGIGVSAALQHAESVLDNYRSGLTLTAKVAFFASGAEMLLPGAMVWLSEHAPNVRLEAHFVEPAGREAGALTADYDLVVGHSFDGPQIWHGHAEVIVLFREPLDVALPISHPLAESETVAAADVTQYNWIGVPEGYPFHRVIAAIEKKSGQSLRVAQRFPDLRVMEALIEAGIGIGILGRFTAQRGNGSRFLLKPLNDVESGRTIAILLRADKSRSSGIRLVVEALRTVARQIEADFTPVM